MTESEIAVWTQEFPFAREFVVLSCWQIICAKETVRLRC